MVAVAKLVAAQGCGPCVHKGRAGSTPVGHPKGINYEFIHYGTQTIQSRTCYC